MWFPSILHSRRSRSRRARPARKASRRLILEPLEGRTLPSFLTPVSYPVGTAPTAVAVGDFNHDGTLDLAVANYSSGTVSVLLGKGDGTFQPARNYVVGGTLHSIAVGDFNNDGKLDIVTTSYRGSTVSVLLGNGDGTFQPPLNYALPTEGGATQYPLSLAVGDFNKDGKLDLAVTAYTYTPGYYGGTSTGYVNVLIGNGAGSFSTDNVYALGATIPRGVAVGDFTGNRNLDLAVDEEDLSNVIVLMGNGNGTFGAPTPFPTGYQPKSVAVGDFNGDGKLDLVTANLNTVSVLLGNGNGTFQPPASYTVGGDSTSVAVADFDRDGKLDIVSGSSSPGSVSVLLGNGDGTFHSTQNYAVGSNAGSVAVGDFNGDGWPDVAVTNYSGGTVSVLLNTGDWTTLVASFPSSITAGVAGSLTVVAKNPDGTTATNYNGTVHFTSSDPQAVLPADYTFTAADAGVHTFSVTLKTAGTQLVFITTPATPFLDIAVGTTVNPAAASGFGLAAPSAVSAGSAFTATVTAFDPYGNLATGYTGTVQFASTDPKAVLPAPYTFTTGSGGDNGVHNFANGCTLNTAGSQTVTATDKATSSITGSAAMTVVNPFLPPVSYPVGNGPDAVAVGDFNNDGIPDLVVANLYSDNVSVLLGKGDGTFQPAQNYAVDGAPESVAVGDFNGDGKLDIVTANSTSGVTVSVLLGKGDGTFQSALNYVLPTQAGLAQILSGLASLAVGDFNKDAKLDVAVGTFTSPYGAQEAYVNVLVGNGAGGFSADNISAVGLGEPRSIAAGDFNGDGNLDLALSVYNPHGSDSVSVLLGNGNGTFRSPTSFAAPYALSMAVGDFNGDGKLDLALGSQMWMCTGGYGAYGCYGSFIGEVAVLLGNGDGTFGTATSYPVPAPAISLAVADVNRDGKADLVVANGSDVSVLVGIGNGTFGTALNYPAGPAGSQAGSVAVADFNRDGWPDLAVANAGSNTVSVLLNPANGPTLAVSGFPSSTTVGVAGSFTVTVHNNDGTIDTGYTGTLHFTSSDLQGILPADYTFTAADAGVHTFSATLKTTGVQSITATDTTKSATTGTDAGITVNLAAGSSFAVSGFPSPTAAGTVGNFTIAAKNANGTTATGYRGTVHFTSSDPQAVLPADYTFTAIDAGVHTFSATLKTAGTESITATDTTTGSITGSQAGITINPLAVSALSVAGFPLSATAGVAGTFTVIARDAYGNRTGYLGTVHFTSSDPQAVLPANYTFTAADAGMYTFSAILKSTGPLQSITATDTTMASLSGSQTGINVQPGPMTTFLILVPSPINGIQAGVAYPYAVVPMDAYGNQVYTYAGTIHFTSSDPQAILPADYTFNPGNGVTFYPILRTAGQQTITVSDTVNNSITATVTVKVVPAIQVSSLVVRGFPSPITSGLAGNFTVTAKTANGTTATNYTGTVHFTSSDPQAVLPADYTFTAADAGVHTFSATLKTAGTQSMTATDTTTASLTATDAGITVNPARASKFIITTPSSVTAGVKFKLTVTVEDAYGNVVTGYTGTVHLSSTDSTATLPQNYTFTAADNGVHTFTGLVLRKKGYQTITLTDTLNNSLTSSVIVDVL